jgi:MOSC domain-containing protein YiiM
MGRVAAVCSSERKGTIKKEIGRATLIEDFGMEGDAHGGFAHRQISLISSEDVESMRSRLPGVSLPPGSFAENILTEGVDLASLSIGDRLKAGECLLEVSQIGKECHKECEIARLTGECVMPKKGIFCRVVTGGCVQTGDAIELA